MNPTMAIEDWLHPFLGNYLNAPEWLKASAGQAYRCLPQAVRLGPEYGRFMAQIDGTSTPGPMQKLDETLRWALETVPAYARFKALARGGRDPREVLEQLPITDKLDMKHATERYLSKALPPSARLETYTGGSTRHPMRFFLHKHVTRPKEAAFMSDFRSRVGPDSEALVLALRGRTVPTAGEPDGKLWTHEPIRRQLLMSCDHLERRYMPKYAEALALHKPEWIEAFPSALYPLARWLAENPMPEFTSGVKGVMLFSENVHEPQLAKIREVFHCPVIAHYGHSERVLMAGTVPGDDRYFFWPQYGHLELLDERDRPITEPGRVGFIVGTSFDNRVMPFVRYRTGDLGVLSATGHPQLPGYPAIDRILGRLQEFVVCRDERLVSITTIGVAHFPELAAADATQYEQAEPGRLLLKLTSEQQLSDATLARIRAAVEKKLQGGCTVDVRQVPRIERTPRGKARMIVQHLDVRPYFGATAGE
jgi:phenylacetate-CoA ligase